MARKDRRRFLTGVFAGALAAPVLAAERTAAPTPKARRAPTPAQFAAAETADPREGEVARIKGVPGKTAFVKHGCWQCHGFMGQGGQSGAKLAPNPMPYERFSAYVRNTNRSMPPYQKAILSDEDLADIHAYLQSIPPAKDYKSIPLLNP